jgi:GDP-L-fucose synthase
MTTPFFSPKKSSKIYIAGHRGMVGSAVVRQLKKEGYHNLLTADSQNLDLRRQHDTELFLKYHKPEAVVICAATVGGIKANNTYRGDFIYNNLQIQLNLIEASRKEGVQKLIFLGSSCIYPKFSPQPIREEYLLTGSLEPTNEPYAIAKIAGIKLCQSFYDQHGSNFYSLMPCNLYGDHDNFDLKTSHVLPALMRKFHEATQRKDSSVQVWGSGRPKREFLLVDDLATVVSHCIKTIDASQIYDNEISQLNVGSGMDISIKELASLMADCTGFKGKIKFDPSQPDGTLEKLMDVSRLKKLELHNPTPLEKGIKATYQWFKNHEY